MFLYSGSRLIRLINRVGSLLAVLAATFAFLLAWWSNPRRPASASASDGWWSGFDQGHYLSSALAFAHGNLSPGAHWYLPIYPALASLFVRLMPGDPFMVPDLACLLAALWLSGGLGAELIPDWRWGRLAGFASFLACVVAPPVTLKAWVVPWTSTLAAPLMLGCLRATLAGMRCPHRRGPPLLAGFAGAAVAGCRPADAVLVLACAGGIGSWVVLRESGLPAAIRSWLPSFALGSVVGLLPTVLLYCAIWGLHESPYMASSALVGFEWRLLPLRWVELMISPRPIVPEGSGLTQVLPFIGTGLLGLAAAMTLKTERIRHVLTAAAVVSSIVLYLCYRDLHASGLWLFSNYHYFKWSFGLLGLYSLILVRTVWTLQGSRPFWLLPLAILLSCWRVVPHRFTGSTGTVTGPDRFSILVPALHVDEAVVASAVGPFDPIYFGQHNLAIGKRPILPIQDFKAIPIFGGLMITPLRPWPAGLLAVHLTSGINLTREPAPFVARLDLDFGIPCWLGVSQAGCGVDSLLPPRLLPEAQTLLFDGSETPFLGPGWSYAEPGGRWTSGSAAELRFRIPRRQLDRDIVLKVSTSAIWRRGLHPLDVKVAVDGHIEGEEHFDDGTTRSLAIPIRISEVATDGAVDVWFRIANPHRPLDIFPSSHDVRPLGLYVRSISWGVTPVR